MKVIEGKMITQKSKIAIIIPRFNNFINQHLLTGSIDILTRIGEVSNKNITIIKVPGAYEIPVIANIISQKQYYHGIIALGTIIKGETIHFENISNEVSSKLSDISIKNNIPITLGILMINNIEQAIHRSGTKLGNKGSEAALAILEMINVIKQLKNESYYTK
ncbi:6,7-dimethyl-8-ribityllumazine synthase [Buchnera aphidicola]|uniref:6,7-dimethyl-8-ribityllumazine synthase n=1 Tax=Buchnera aphidicola (Stegophylla sp.) TaxID=2315800 RepID=A0A4D6YLL5_9GAMM|nr:6,7-dimethyl-8-ribityllumazine synthase [Buchnera aphidicola (Stegophylla sp.)]QCI26548.1 6,7-dimethyl-8-ribityllumazine synthase [Buchnera aphidicola (Stegophylla sp.)]